MGPFHTCALEIFALFRFVTFKPRFCTRLETPLRTQLFSHTLSIKLSRLDRSRLSAPGGNAAASALLPGYFVSSQVFVCCYFSAREEPK